MSEGDRDDTPNSEIEESVYKDEVTLERLMEGLFEGGPRGGDYGGQPLTKINRIMAADGKLELEFETKGHGQDQEHFDPELCSIRYKIEDPEGIIPPNTSPKYKAKLAILRSSENGEDEVVIDLGEHKLIQLGDTTWGNGQLVGRYRSLLEVLYKPPNSGGIFTEIDKTSRLVVDIF